MRKVTDVCVSFLGNQKMGNRQMVFDRLAWWLTRSGMAEMTRLQSDPAWDEPLVVGFDTDGNPMELSRRIEGQIAGVIDEVSVEPLPLTEAETVVSEMVESGLSGNPMPFSNRWEKARVNMFRLIYNARRRAWRKARSRDL